VGIIAVIALAATLFQAEGMPMPESPFKALTLHSYAHLLDKGFAYRLAVISPTVSGVVTAAGSWLFDRAKGGWRIGLFVIDPVEPADAAALRILGVDKVEPLSARKLDDIESASAIAVDSTVQTMPRCLPKGCMPWRYVARPRY